MRVASALESIWFTGYSSSLLCRRKSKEGADSLFGHGSFGGENIRTRRGTWKALPSPPPSYTGVHMASHAAVYTYVDLNLHTSIRIWRGRKANG